MNSEHRNSHLTFFISAGEASGETYGAQIIDSLRSLAPGCEFFGLGGPRMQSAGCDLVANAREVSVVGLSEVISHLPLIYRKFRQLVRATDVRRPDAAILIDFPDFNFRLARQLHRRGIPVFYFVSPQLWAWRRGRIKLVQRYVRKMLVIFPFEEQFYRDHGVDAFYVGHPLADLPSPSTSRDNFAAEHGLHPEKTWIALLPGSRRKEVLMNLPEMLRAARRFSANNGGCQFLLPVAPTLDLTWLRYMVQGMTTSAGIDVRCLFDNARAALSHARSAVVASGTATVEAALIGTPFVMVYRVSDLTWRLGRRLVKVPHYGMVNLIAGREVVPELVQSNFTAENVAAQLREITDEGPERAEMIRNLAEVRCKLHADKQSNSTAALRAAQSILAELR